MINNLKGDLKLQKPSMNIENDTVTTDTLTKFLIKKDLLGTSFSYNYPNYGNHYIYVLLF